MKFRIRVYKGSPRSEPSDLVCTMLSDHSPNVTHLDRDYKVVFDQIEG